MRKPGNHKPKVRSAQSSENLPKGTESRQVATLLLTRVVDDKRNLDALCDHAHGVRQYLALNEKDRSLARAIAITALRNRNRIEFILKKLMNRPPPKNARFLIHSLHVAAAQILLMEVPERAAVNIAVGAIGNDKRTVRFKDLANAVLRRMAREKEKLLEVSKAVSPFPAWLEKMLRSNYGKEKLANLAEAVREGSAIDLTVKSNPEQWTEKLEGIVLPTGSVRLRSNTPVTQLSGFEEGEWWVQDAAASLPARLINAEAGARVLELCAAPGGKTAQLINMGFDVTALDISATRLSRLQDNLNRLNFQAITVEADILEWEPGQPYDAVLLDAPCSSTGTVRRHPDVLWTKGREEAIELAELQFKLICKAVSFVRSGGCLVFSNCSMLKEEGENLLGRITTACPELSISPIEPEEIPGIAEMVNGQGALRSQPYHLPNPAEPELGGLDGFFACRFIKN